jgi:hypothetical protein
VTGECTRTSRALARTRGPGAGPSRNHVVQRRALCMRRMRPARMIEKAMTLLTVPGDGPAFPYAGRPMHILPGHDRMREIYARRVTRLLP